MQVLSNYYSKQKITRHKDVKTLLYNVTTYKIKGLQMQTQTIKIELSINGQKVIIGHQFLEDVIRNIPDIKDKKSF